MLLPPYMAHHVQYLQADRQHGAAELAAYVLQVCFDTCGSAWEAAVGSDEVAWASKTCKQWNRLRGRRVC